MSAVALKYNLSGQQSLLNMANAINNTNLTLLQVAIGNPVVGVSPAATFVMVTPTITSGLTGVIPLNYMRLDIGQYFLNAGAVLNFAGPPTEESVLAALLSQYQVYFDPTGVDLSSACTVVLDPNYPHQATVVPDPNNLLWIGSLVISVDPRPLLSSILEPGVYPGFTLPAGLSVTSPAAELVYGVINGQNSINDVEQWHAGDVFSGYLQTWPLGVALTSNPWMASATPGPYNIYGASVTYNGPATGGYAILNGDGTPFVGNVLVIALGPACTNLVGDLLITYVPVAQVPAPSPTPAPPPIDSPHLLYN
jgi:hypothetical protein